MTEPPSHVLPEHLRDLCDPAAYGHAVTRVELVQTHVSWVFLTGELAYKIKRPVRYAFVDLRDAERRAFYCGEEVRLNRRFAPDLYLGVCPVTRIAGRARMGGEGEVIDHAVQMRQFQREEGLDRLISGGRIAPEALGRFGGDLARIHADLPEADETADWGRSTSTAALLERNLDECARAVDGLGLRTEVEALRGSFSTMLGAARPWMNERRKSGRVRECHGDLHCGNVVRLGGRLTAFDCMEFEPAFRWIDVAQEIAFLTSDLEVRQAPRHAHAFLAGYLHDSGDFSACRFLHVYEAHGALVRAKVDALAIPGLPPEIRGARQARCRQRIAYVRRALERRRGRLILLSGLSGSGKTWLASRLAPLLDAVHLRSDVERKRLLGMEERARSHAGLDQGPYSPQTSERVYARLVELAEDVLAGGYTVIVDATFLRAAQRQRFAAFAKRMDAEAYIVHCQAPGRVLRERIEARLARAVDASEADLEVLRWQEAQAEPIAEAEGWQVIEADTSDAAVVEKVARRLSQARGPDGCALRR